jgi:hypothetical protein
MTGILQIMRIFLLNKTKWDGSSVVRIIALW